MVLKASIDVFRGNQESIALPNEIKRRYFTALSVGSESVVQSMLSEAMVECINSMVKMSKEIAACNGGEDYFP